jgi:hypothetical protein
MCWLWVCCLVLWRGLYRESPVVLSAVSVSAVGFEVGGVLLSSYRAVAKGELLCPRGRWAVGIVAGRRFLFLCFWFSVMSSAGVER